MASVLEVAEGLQTESSNESLPYGIDTSSRGTPTSPTVQSVKNRAGTDVKSTVMPSGSPTVSGDIISLPLLTALTAGERYEIRTTYVIGTSTQETIINVDCPL